MMKMITASLALLTVTGALVVLAQPAFPDEGEEQQDRKGPPKGKFDRKGPPRDRDWKERDRDDDGPPDKKGPPRGKFDRKGPKKDRDWEEDDRPGQRKGPGKEKFDRKGSKKDGDWEEGERGRGGPPRGFGFPFTPPGRGGFGGPPGGGPPFRGGFGGPPPFRGGFEGRPEGPAREKEREGEKGPARGSRPGIVLSPELRERLQLSEVQARELNNLEREVLERLERLLTPSQRRQLQQLGAPEGRGPGRERMEPQQRRPQGPSERRERLRPPTEEVEQN